MKTTKVYSGPGYPLDPKREELRNLDRVAEALDFACELIRERPMRFVNEFFFFGQNRVEDLIGTFESCVESPFLYVFEPLENHCFRRGGIDRILMIHRTRRRRDRRIRGAWWVKHGINFVDSVKIPKSMPVKEFQPT